MDMDVVRIAQNHLELMLEEMKSCKDLGALIIITEDAKDALDCYFNALKATLDE